MWWTHPVFPIIIDLVDDIATSLQRLKTTRQRQNQRITHLQLRKKLVNTVLPWQLQTCSSWWHGSYLFYGPLTMPGRYDALWCAANHDSNISTAPPFPLPRSFLNLHVSLLIGLRGSDVIHGAAWHAPYFYIFISYLSACVFIVRYSYVTFFIMLRPEPARTWAKPSSLRNSHNKRPMGL